MLRGFLLAIGATALVVLLSWTFTALWKAEPEQIPSAEDIVLRKEMTLGEFISENELPAPVARQAIGVTASTRLSQPMESLELQPKEIRRRTGRALALYAEHGSKNWGKILLKFVLWFATLGVVFVLMRRRRVSLKVRLGILMFAAVLFGVVLGSDPNPMGTVKDAVVLYGEHGVLFMPRLIAMGVFLALVVLANKFICAWGCQLGTFQDFLFQAGRQREGRRSRWPQFKPPFVVTNTVRVLTSVAMVIAALPWSFDLVGMFDAFKLFHPQVIGIAAGTMIAAVALLSPFWYRPWCHLFCPFGLVGWIFEKISLFHIRVDYNKCISCLRCEKSCPSTVMSAILRKDKHAIPDCFACSTCIQVCPTDAISLTTLRRTRPPEGEFDPRGSAERDAAGE